MADNYSKSANSPEDTKAQILVRQSNQAFNDAERANVETIWAELARYFLPSQNSKFFGDISKGILRDNKTYDSTGSISCRDLSSAMHSTITNPAAKWGKLRFNEASLNDIPAANKWCSIAESAMFDALNESNFDSQIGRGYNSLTALATMVLLHDEITEDGKHKGMNFVSWHLGEVAYAENHLGLVDRIFRKFTLTYRQAWDKFGSSLGDGFKQDAENKPFDSCQFLHCIYPRDKSEVVYNEQGLAAPNHRPVASDYILLKGNKLVLEDGYYENPVYVSRWLTLPGEIYGFGPGHIARANMATLNVLTRQILKGLARAVDPVIFQTRNNILTGDLRPGRIVPVQDINGIKEGVTQSRFDIAFLQAKDLKESVKSAFYIDKLMLPPRTETGEMTAYEIQQRMEQMQVILGPPLSRLNQELLTPLIMRTLSILMRAGIIPPIPQEVLQRSSAYKSGKNTQDISIQVAFVNPLARSQQMSELRNITAFLQEAAGIAQSISPTVVDNIDVDATIEKMARIRDVPEEMMASTDAVKAIRDQRAKASQMATAMQAGESLSNTAKNAAQAQQGQTITK